MADFRIVVPTNGSEQFKKNFNSLSDRFQRAFTAAVNMAASMIKAQGDADIASSGNFSDMTSALHVNVEGEGALGNMRMSMIIDDERAGIFATGGVIHGNPLLWIGLSGTDAEGVRARDYPDGLFSVNRKSGGVPLLFSIKDKAPKYFGIESVTIPKKWHLDQVVQSVMGNFRQIFDQALQGEGRE